MSIESKLTTDHEEIRRWVEEHGGRPASVRGTEDQSASGVLHIDFPGGAGEEQLEHVPWERWFDVFERNGLGFLYQERKADGEDSTFFKLVSREHAATR